MSYLTVEVDIDHGQITPKGTEVLPEKATGLLTILQPTESASLRPVGLAKGLFVVPENFNEPLPESVLHSFEGK